LEDRAVVAGRRWGPPGRDWRVCVGEAGVEGDIVGDTVGDEIGAGPGILTGVEPHSIDGLLGSK